MFSFFFSTHSHGTCNFDVVLQYFYVRAHVMLDIHFLLFREEKKTPDMRTWISEFYTELHLS